MLIPIKFPNDPDHQAAFEIGYRLAMADLTQTFDERASDDAFVRLAQVEAIELRLKGVNQDFEAYILAQDDRRQELIEANNRYLEEGRAARRELAALKLTLKGIEKQRDDTLASVARVSQMLANFSTNFVKKHSGQSPDEFLTSYPEET